MKGLFVPQFTAFNHNQKVDYVATREHASWLLENGVTGLVPFGTFGEGSALSLLEKMRVTKDLVNIMNGKYLIPTIISNSLGEITEYLEFVEELPLKAIMVSPPSYYRPISDAGMIDFYRHIAQKSSHPIIAYNIPATALTISTSIACQIPIWGVKDSSGSLRSTEDFLAKNVKVLIGSDSLLVEGLKKGAAGGICGLSNLFPSEMVSVYKNYLAGNVAEAESTLARLVGSTSAFLKVGYGVSQSIAAFKSVANSLNKISLGSMRLPSSNLTVTTDVLELVKKLSQT